MKLDKKVICFFSFILAFVFFSFSLFVDRTHAKSPPLGANNTQIPSNILLLLDVSGSMNSYTAPKIQLPWPKDVALDNDGNIYVLTTNKCSLMKIDATTKKKVREYSDKCRRGGYRDLIYPTYMAINNVKKEIVVANTYRRTLMYFDFNLSLLDSLTMP